MEKGLHSKAEKHSRLGINRGNCKTGIAHSQGLHHFPTLHWYQGISIEPSEGRAYCCTEASDPVDTRDREGELLSDHKAESCPTHTHHIVMMSEIL